MSTGVGRIQPAELAIPCGVSSTGLSTLGPAELLCSAGVSSVGIPLLGAAEDTISCGDERNGVDYVEPALIQWAIKASGWTGYTTLEVLAPTETSGSPCTVQFYASRLGAEVALLPFSNPEQSAPHTAEVDTDTDEYQGETVDLFWRYQSGAEVSALVQIGQVYISVDGEVVISSGVL